MKNPLLLLVWCMLLCIAMPVTKVLAQSTSGEQCFVSPTNPNVVNAKSTWTYNAIDQTITIRTVLAKSFVDNTYSDSKDSRYVIGWPANNHTFRHLVTSDELQLALYDKYNTKKLEFMMDYFSSTSTALYPSGYGTLGVTGGDGAMLYGSSSNVVKVRTSLTENFNTYGYVLTTNSPATDANYTPNPSYPNWIYEVWYEVTVKASAFGSAGFGRPSITGVHASPSKTGNDTEKVQPGDCPCKLGVSAVVKSVTCNGSSNGAIDVSISGCSNTPTYKWSDGPTTQDRTNLKAGTYTVTVTSNPDCKVTQSYTVTQPAVLSLTAVTSNITMVGGANGAINITVTGGTPPYTYAWNDGVTTEDRTGLKAGTYTVTVTDKNGCKTMNSYTLTEPTCTLGISGVKKDVTCNGAANGSIDVTVTGAKGILSYKWSDGTTTEDRTGLAPGTYSVTVTDQSTGCKTTSQNFSISQPTTLGITTSTTNVVLVGGSTGAINITVSGGTPPYSYQWNDGVTTEDRTGLKAGNYNVTVTDANGCKAMQSFTITEPVCNLSVSGTKKDVTCNGAANGSINVTTTGAAGTLTYKWNDGATTEDRSSLPPGTYSVTATDQSTGCKITSQNFVVNEPDVLGVAGNITNVKLVGGSTGAIDVTVTGGTPPYTYAWSDGVSTEDRTGLSAGSYSVTVTDANGCKAIQSFTITEPVCNLSVSGTKKNITCNGANNGSIDVTVTGAASVLSYKWSDGVTTEDRSNLTPGTYTVTATDNSTGCETSKSFTISQPAALSLTASAVNVVLVGGSTGSVDVTVNGGTPPYSYQWNDGVTTEDRTGLKAGIYSVTVTDANGCQTSDSYTITEPVCNLIANGTKKNVSCNGAADGNVDVTVTGAAGTLTYKWNDNVTTEDRSALAPGTYTVIVTDQSTGCTTTQSFTITEPTILGVSAGTINVTMVGGSDGAIDITVTGGTPPYTYIWSDGATTEDRTGLSAGSYGVTVTDVNGCKTMSNYTITQPVCNVNVDGTKANVTCNGAANGSIDVTVTGSTGTVSYSWNDGVTTEDRTNLAPGTYTVTATDISTGCEKSRTFVITQPAAINITANAINASAPGVNNGSIDITVTGGTSPYTYAWNDGVTTEDRSGLSAGDYTVTVTDANGCKATQSFTITQPACNLNVTGVKKNVTCNGAANGSIDVTSSGGIGTLSYSWSDGVTTEDRTNLAPGTYTVTATDQYTGCKATKGFTVTEPETLDVTGVVTNATTVGGANGAINITVTGGTPPYIYAWNDGVTTEDRTGLSAGTYTVYITDANGCKTTNTFVITQPSCSLGISGTKKNLTCYGSANGSIDVTTTGAKGIVTYKWSDGVTTEDRTGLNPGTYRVVATDPVTGCRVSQTFIITEPSLLTVEGVITSSTGSNGAVDITADGGTPPYTYMWTDGVTTEDRSGLAPGIYSVVVTDSHGCTAEECFAVNQPACTIAMGGNKQNVTCNGAANGSIDISITGAKGTVTYKWSDGVTTEDRTNLAPGIYDIVATDESTGCKASQSFTISEPSQLIVNGSVIDVTTIGGSNGSVDITASGGTSPYTYAWNDGVTTEDRSGLSAGDYTVTVTDANGCKATQSFTINQPACTLEVTYKVTRPKCYGGSDGAINLTVKGATGAVTYKWSDGPTTEDRTALIAGTYTVVVADAGGCKDTAVIKITQPTHVSGTYTSTPASTGKCDGSITVTGKGGTAPYTYIWQDNYNGAYRGNLCKGTYYVCIFDYNGCVDTLKVIVKAATTTLTARTTTTVAAPSTAKISAPIASVRDSKGSIEFNATLSPNPTTGLVKLAINAPASGYAVMNVLDMNGRKLSTAKITLLKGVNYHELNLGGKANGMYTIELIDGDNKKALKVIVSK